MFLPFHIAQKLLQLLDGQAVAAGEMRHAVVQQMLDEQVLSRHTIGGSRARLRLRPGQDLAAYIHHHFGIPDLAAYAAAAGNETLTRSEAVQLAGDSKFRAARSFSGFLVCSYSPVPAMLHGQPFTVQTVPGTFLFISDAEHFRPAEDITIIGVENPENFRCIHLQQYLFPGIRPLFLSRYPQTQTGDVRAWLNQIPNTYLHFGDLDIAGIRLYLHEYKKHLGPRARFFVPEQLGDWLQRFGNRDLYNRQAGLEIPSTALADEPELETAVRQIHQYRKGLEQEVFIRQQNV